MGSYPTYDTLTQGAKDLLIQCGISPAQFEKTKGTALQQHLGGILSSRLNDLAKTDTKILAEQGMLDYVITTAQGITGTSQIIQHGTPAQAIAATQLAATAGQATKVGIDAVNGSGDAETAGFGRQLLDGAKSVSTFLHTYGGAIATGVKNWAHNTTELMVNIKEVMCHTMEVVAKLESNTHFEAWQFLTPQEQLDVMETYAKQGEQLVQSMDQLVTNVGNATSVQVVEKGVEIILDCATARVVGKLATGATSLAAKRLVPLLKEAEVIHETEKFAALEGRLVKAGEKVAAATEKSIA